MVQDLCATAALAALDEEEAYEDVLPPLLSAGNPRARSAGVTGLRRAGRPKRAEPFLGDPSALVCACARYVVRQQGGDPAAWYRERCAAPDTLELPPGPAECGNRADAGRDQRVAGEDGEGGLGAKPARLRPPDQDGAGR
ncbi:MULTISPECIES: hypothetical protein [unclassified Streptomyces]|uniref:hypothetical protein n=1 Tax=unclassified Streptomyces TaxID=2593676 RepID=UPI000DC2C383|nr:MULTISPECIES: hypothetical protein [unclassified Streptomyces]RAJ48540.1 hypothetical protein K376_07096 [Streptomyces sp. PsTaAH-130]